MPEVITPPPSHRVQVLQELFQRDIGRTRSASDDPYFLHDPVQGFLRWVRIHHFLVDGSGFTAPLDTEPEEVETVLDVHDTSLLGRQSQSRRSENGRHFLSQVLSVMLPS